MAHAIDMEQVEIDHEPTLDDMDKLSTSQFYVFNDMVHVKAAKIWKPRASCDVAFSYMCPYCPKRPTRFHRHGTDEKTDARWEQRICHCHNSNYMPPWTIWKEKWNNKLARPKTLSREVRIAIVGRVIEERRKK